MNSEYFTAVVKLYRATQAYKSELHQQLDRTTWPLERDVLSARINVTSGELVQQRNELVQIILDSNNASELEAMAPGAVKRELAFIRHKQQKEAATWKHD